MEQLFFSWADDMYFFFPQHPIYASSTRTCNSTQLKITQLCEFHDLGTWPTQWIERGPLVQYPWLRHHSPSCLSLFLYGEKWRFYKDSAAIPNLMLIDKQVLNSYACIIHISPGSNTGAIHVSKLDMYTIVYRWLTTRIVNILQWNILVVICNGPTFHF